MSVTAAFMWVTAVIVAVATYIVITGIGLAASEGSDGNSSRLFLELVALAGCLRVFMVLSPVTWEVALL